MTAVPPGFANLFCFAKNSWIVLNKQKIHRNCEKKTKTCPRIAKKRLFDAAEKMTRAVDGFQLFSFRWPNP